MSDSNLNTLSLHYNPKLNKMTGGMLASIFLQRCIYFDEISGGKPFIKFQNACNHPLYLDQKEKGQFSWCEELGVSKHEFATVLDKIAYKNPSKEKWRKFSEEEWRIENEKISEAFIWYWMGRDRITFWTINRLKVFFELSEIYDLKTLKIKP